MIKLAKDDDVTNYQTATSTGLLLTTYKCRVYSVEAVGTGLKNTDVPFVINNVAE